MFRTVQSSLLLSALLLTGVALAHSGPGAHEQPSQQSQLPGDQARQDIKAAGAQREARQPHATVEQYQDFEVLGWTLHVHEDLVAEEELFEEVRAELHHQLFRIVQVLPEDRVEILQEVPVWVELRNPYSGNCQYHPSRQWLENNGYLPEKAQGIELSAARGFLSSSRTTQPFVMLHELAHAYHDRHLGFDHEGLIQRFREAREAGSYDRVLHANGRRVRAYAMTDHKEFFAEATEAYFGQNDFFPFVRAELREHDQAMYDMVREVWGIE